LHTLTAILYRWRVHLSAVIVAGALAFIPSANITHVDNDIGAWFSRDDPVYRDYERFRAEFGGTQPLIVALRAETPAPGPGSGPAADGGAGIFTRDRLEFLTQITEDIERVPSVHHVQGLANTSLLTGQHVAGEDRLDFQLLLDRRHRSLVEIRELALRDPLLRDELLSRDGRLTAIVVTFDEAVLNQSRREILERIHTLVDARLPPGMSAYYNGSIEISETYNRVTIENQRRFLPPIFALTLLATYALFRSVARTAVVMFSIGVSVLWTLGLYSAMGFDFNILAAMLTPLVVVLAISDDVHIIQHYDEHRRKGTPEYAFSSTVSDLLLPLFGASATTALGLLSLVTSDVVAVRQFGAGAAVGVMVDFAISLILVPTLLGSLAPQARETPHERLIAPLRNCARFASRRPTVVVAASLVAVIGAVAGIARLRVDTNHITFFAASHPLSQSAAVIDRDLAGIYSFNVFIEGTPDSMLRPETLARVERLSDAITKLPRVRKVTSIVDYVKRTNQELHNGDPAAAVIPGDSAAIGQEVLLLSLAAGGRQALERLVSADFSKAQIVVRLPSMNSDLVFEHIQAAQQLATEIFRGTAVTATVAGSGRLFSALDHYLVRSQISSFATALVTIFAAMFLIFRSVRYGLLALVPNLFPVVAVLGAMGWLGISLNVATVMVASVALGIVDDDTIHFLNRFRRQRETGATIADAIDVAATGEGRAALTTALISSCGFSVLMLSEYKPSAWFGGLLALTLGVAFLSEILILPATISVVSRIRARTG
jgi:uncharacterized protein